jgi:hypothetical protein
MKILNLTQHPATPDQAKAGVIDLPEDQWAHIKEALTFNDLPDATEIEERALYIALKAVVIGHDVGATHAMIGGAPYLMAPLEQALEDYGIHPVYAFSQRETEEQTQEDGSVRKVATFRHLGFIGPATFEGRPIEFAPTPKQEEADQ